MGYKRYSLNAPDDKHKPYHLYAPIRYKRVARVLHGEAEEQLLT